MIVSFGSKATRDIWNGEHTRGFSTALQEVARRKLRMLNNSQNLTDLRTPPSNHLEKLKGRLKAYHSIRINNQWRIIFVWRSGNAADVEITDYH